VSREYISNTIQRIDNPTKCVDCPVRRQALFRSVPMELIEFSAEYRSQQYILPAKQFLYMEGEAIPDVFTLYSGWVKLTKSLHNGRQQVMRFGLAGDLLGYQSHLDGPMNHSVQALTDITVCAFPRKALLELMQNSAAVSSELAWLSARDMALCHEHLLNASCKNAQQRVAHLLLELFYRNRDATDDSEDNFEIEIPITQEDIAEATGLTAVHVSRTLKQLREMGLLECHRHQLKILEEQAIIELSQFNRNILYRPML